MPSTPQLYRSINNAGMMLDKMRIVSPVGVSYNGATLLAITMEERAEHAITLLLVEDFAIIRAGMCALLDGLPNINVIASARNGREALALLEIHQPDIVMMDLELPYINGRQATATITREYPDVRVIILSMHTDQQSVVEALQAGAVGYLPKSANDHELQQAIEMVMQGQTYVSPHVSHHLINYIRQDEEPEDEDSALTPRQIEILKLIANGRSTKEIAQQLHISIKTVEAHRANIMERLNIRDVAGLVRYALKTGLVEA